MDPLQKITGNKNQKGGFKFKMKVNLWTILLGLVVLFFTLPFILAAFELKGGDNTKVDTSQMINDIKAGKMDKVLIQSDRLLLTYKDGASKIGIKEDNQAFADLLQKSGIDPSSVHYTVIDQSLSKVFGEVLGVVLPLIVLGAFFYFMIKVQNKGAQDIFSFGRSRAKLFAKGKQSINFSDVAGVDDAKKELEEVVDFLKYPEKYRRIGARTPKGVLLVGPAGVGKTLLAKALAGEAAVPFFSMAGSEFMEMLVGVGASRVRDLFAQAKAAAPSIIFIDEIDAIGRQRGRGIMGGHDEREQTLNQILVELDGFTPNDNVLVVAATNRGDLLDPALLRPGRFDRRVTLDVPDKEGRVAILKIHSRNKKFGKDIDWGKVADRTIGFSGADLENMLNEAAILAARSDKKEIDMADISESATKVKLGPAKKRLQSEDDRKLTAYHEAGHAVVAHILPKVDPVNGISIVARGMSLGHTLITPVADRVHETKSRLLQQITAMLGGRAAEDVVFNEQTSGASNDIERATQLARAMVVDFGMSSLGPINFGAQHEYGDFGVPEYFEGVHISESMQQRVDNEVKTIMDACYKESVVIIKKYKKKMDDLVEELMKKETLDKDEFLNIVGDKESVYKPANLSL
ncbi:ATP-dependent zinc metalloprotease FtsH [Candidatus Woesebacteria bacterium]|nr:ATP-dependent zinc metalloprotease FtsH [Candidatus Woesebacteria bacterium]